MFVLLSYFLFFAALAIGLGRVAGAILGWALTLTLNLYFWVKDRSQRGANTMQSDTTTIPTTFMGFYATLTVDWHITSWGSRATFHDPAWPTEWDVDAIALTVEQLDGSDGPSHDCTGGLFRALARSADVENALSEAVSRAEADRAARGCRRALARRRAF